MAIGVLTATVARTPAGRYDLKWRDGIETPSPPQIFIATIPTQALTAGSSYSVDYATFVTGTDKPGSTYALEAVSGTIGALGLTFTTSTLAGATPIAGNATMRLAVTKSGYTFRSDAFLITVAAAPVTDVQAPAVPPPPTATVNSATSITVAGSYSMDVATPSVTATGLDAMILQRCVVTGGVEGVYTDRATITAPSDGFTGLGVQDTIGSPGGSPTITQTGANYAFSSGSGSLSGTSDSVKVVRWQITGDFELIATMADFRHGDDPFAASVVMFRQDLTVGSPYYRDRRWSSASGKGIGAAWRTAQGGAVASSTAITANIPSDAIVRRRRVGNLFTVEFLDTAGAWILVNSQTVVMSSTIYACLCAIRSTVGTNVAFNINNVIINTLGAWSYPDTTTGGVNYRYKLKARDNALLVSAASLASQTYTTPAAVVNFKRVHPGWYIMLDGAKITAAKKSEHFANIAEIENEPIEGVKVQMYHGDIETSFGVYNWALVDSYRDKCLQHGKRLMLSIQKSVFGGTSPSNLTNGYYFPVYITADPTTYGITALAFGGYVERVWKAAVADRWSAMSAAFAARYDNDVTIECYQTGETAISVTNGTDGFGNPAWNTQLQRILTASAAAWQHTVLRCSTNFLGPTLMPNLMAKCGELGIGCGGPDVLPSESIEANRIFSGYTGGIDYRTKIPWFTEWQSPEMGSKEGNYSCAELDDVCRLGLSVAPVGIAGILPLQATYKVVYRKNFAQTVTNPRGSGPAGGIDWLRDILPYIRTHSGIDFAGCPQNFPACDFSN